MIKKISNKIKLLLFKKKFRKNNNLNFVNALNIFDLSKVEIGKNTYGDILVYEYGVENEKLIIGPYCSLANGVTFLLAGEHSYNRISTYPFKTKILNYKEECFSKGPIEIGADVWIGLNVTVLSGVKIGQGAIIGAGTVVTKDIPPYAIYVNGKIIKYRFEPEVIEELLKINFNKLSDEDIFNNYDFLYKEINKNNIKQYLDKLDLYKED